METCLYFLAFTETDTRKTQRLSRRKWFLTKVGGDKQMRTGVGARLPSVFIFISFLFFTCECVICS